MEPAREPRRPLHDATDEWREDKGHALAGTDGKDRLKAGLPTGCDFVCSPAFRRKFLIFTPFTPRIMEWGKGGSPCGQEGTETAREVGRG